MNNAKSLTALLTVFVFAIMLLTRPVYAGDDRGNIRNDQTPTNIAEFDDGRPVLLAAARHFNRHQQIYHRYGSPQGKAYGYYGQHRHFQPRHHPKFNRHGYRPHRYDYPAVRHYRGYPSYGAYGVKLCFGGHDGYFCFNGHNY